MEVNDLPGFTLPLLAATVAGGAIGFEREWRGRAAGLRTHILVCLASALLMEIAVMQGLWRFTSLPGSTIVTDPARMAHGVLTGIGFLCAGVIFRTGFSIHGLTTAASLWITAAIGLVFGAGLYGLGATATILTWVVLVVLRVVSSKLPQTFVVDAEVTWSLASEGAEAAVRKTLAVHASPKAAEHHELVNDGAELRMGLRLLGVTASQISDLALALRAIPGVVGYNLDPRND